MKRLKIALIVSSLISGTVFADSDGERNYKKSYSIKDFGYYELMDMCGSYDDVGFTSVFGYPEEYKTNYPKIGQLLAEIEAIPAISSENKNYARERIQDAKDKKDAVYKMSSDTRGSVDKNMGYIKSSKALLEDTLQKYGAQKDQLQKESNFVSNEAVKDVLEKISYVPTGIRGVPLDTGPSDYEEWKICLQWWQEGMPFYIKPVGDNDRNNTGYYNPEGFKVGESTQDEYLEHNKNQRDEKLGSYNGGSDFSAESDRIREENGYNDVPDDFGRVYQDKRWWELVEDSDNSGSDASTNPVQDDSWWKNQDRYQEKESTSNQGNWWNGGQDNLDVEISQNQENNQTGSSENSKAAMLRAIAEASLKNNAGRVENVQKKVQQQKVMEQEMNSDSPSKSDQSEKWWD